MADNASITKMMNSSIKSVKTVIPLTAVVGNISLEKAPFIQTGVGVIIGVVGDLRGRLILNGDFPFYKNIATAMYGMELDTNMLMSFIGEIGNMLAGNICSFMYEEGIKIDITPPTVMEGNVSLHGFKFAMQLPITVSGEEIKILFAME